MLTLLAAFALTFANATPTLTVHWPKSKVVCGGMADGESLDFHVTIENEVIGSQSKDERFLLYVDLKKPGRVHWLIAEALTDADYERREQIAAKLAPEDAALIRSITPTRQTELYAGMVDGYVHLDFKTKQHTLSLSCQEQLEDWDTGLKLEP